MTSSYWAVDERRDIAALKITASALPLLPLSNPNQIKSGEPLILISHAAALPWSVSTGVVAAYRLADEVPGAGQGFRLIQFTAAASPGSSGGLLIDGQGRALGIVTGTLMAGQNLNFGVPIESVLGLADTLTAPRRFGNGVALKPFVPTPPKPVEARRDEAVAASTDASEILRKFKTLCVRTHTMNFDAAQVKTALVRTKGFSELGMVLVDDPNIADITLEISFTLPWDYPFEIRHRQTTVTLLTGKGNGPFSAPAGAASVAREAVKLLTPYRKGSNAAKK